MADNTLVVFAGDNGFFWGEHELFGTGRWPYDDSIRVPFIVRYPGMIPDPGRRAGQMILNIDVAPTFLEVAGIPVPEDMEGTSFLPILRSASAPGREAFLYEYFKDFPYRIPPTRGVRTEKYMYIEYEGSPGATSKPSNEHAMLRYSQHWHWQTDIERGTVVHHSPFHEQDSTWHTKGHVFSASGWS